jgi:hypothetical protein
MVCGSIRNVTLYVCKLLSSKPGNRGGFFKFIWDQPGRRLIRFYQPNLAVMEVLDEGTVLVRSHFARPHYLGSIDIGAVINPFLMDIVLGGIAHHYKLAPGLLFEASDNWSARQRQLRGIRPIPQDPPHLGDKLIRDQCHHENRHSEAQRLSPWTPTPQSSQGV